MRLNDIFQPCKDNGGLSIIAVILSLLILSLFGALATTIITTQSDIGLQEEQGLQALYIAEGGIEFTVAKNLNTTNFSTTGNWTNLGAGKFKVDTIAYLTNAADPGDTTIFSDSTAGFPSSGRLSIESDSSITYTGKTATTFTGTTVTITHSANASVYPAAKLSATIPHDPTCAPRAVIDLSNDTGGFDTKNIIFIDTEYFLCASKTALQFQNCERCYFGSASSAHPSANSYASQIVITSTGKVSHPFLGIDSVVRVVNSAIGPVEE